MRLMGEIHDSSLSLDLFSEHKSEDKDEVSADVL
jgi:hypothetical protein